MNKVFIIEDDVKINEQLGSFLKRYGYEVATSFDFENIVDIALEENPKIILLDINLPVFDGYYICKEIRKQSNVPIIVAIWIYGNSTSWCKLSPYLYILRFHKLY